MSVTWYNKNWSKPRLAKEISKKVILLLVLCAGAYVFMLPFLWMLSTSLKPPRELFTDPPQWIPSYLNWANYGRAIKSMRFFLSFKNTATISILSIVGIVISSTMVGYSFSRLRWPGRDFLFVLVLSTLMLPFQVTLIPRFILFTKLGWVNTLKPLIVPNYFGGAFYIFLTRQFFLTIPIELDDAAKVDGCGFIRIYWHVILPLSKPVMATIAIFTFLANWNDFLRPLIYLSDWRKYTLSLALNFLQDEYEVQYSELMAGSILSLLPCITIFFLAQKYFIRGVVLTGVKG